MRDIEDEVTEKLWEVEKKMEEFENMIDCLVCDFDGNVDHLISDTLPLEKITSNSYVFYDSLYGLFQAFKLSTEVIDEYDEIIQSLNKVIGREKIDEWNEIMCKKIRKHYGLEEKEDDK